VPEHPLEHPDPQLLEQLPEQLEQPDDLEVPEHPLEQLEPQLLEQVPLQEDPVHPPLSVLLSNASNKSSSARSQETKCGNAIPINMGNALFNVLLKKTLLLIMSFIIYF
jgi:hypothetical protein